ncbi:hypothetical protein C0992_001200 [Termitomyces sp. T32_za158]|nr:hypothetical protein C0992_001200 [Termitomyces sp. T32_za158]
MLGNIPLVEELNTAMVFGVLLYHIRSTSVTDRATSDTTLINGLGRNCNGPATTLSVVNVIQGKRYRFRLTIIEVDGVNHSPVIVDSIQIYSGQRYSVIVAATQPVGNYWIRALPSAGCTTFESGANSAIFRYLGAAPVEPTTTNSSLHNPLVETSLHPLEDPGAPGGSAPADISLCLNVTRVNGRFAINGASFQPPNVPVLLQIMSGARSAQDLLPAGNVYTLPRNKTVELIIPGGSVGSPVSPPNLSKMFLFNSLTAAPLPSTRSAPRCGIYRVRWR